MHPLIANSSTQTLEPPPVILVASDEKYRELQEQARAASQPRLWIKKVLAGYAALALWPVTAATGAYYLWKRGTNDVRMIEDWWKKLTTENKGKLAIPPIKPDEARGRFHFDPGHPQDGSAYVLNPYREAYYLLPAQANTRLAQDKLYAFVEVNASLGAKHIQVLSASIKKRSSGGAVELAQLAEKIGLNITVDSVGSVIQQGIWEFPKTESLPTIPSDLERWIAADPALSSLVTFRQQYNILNTQSSLEFAETITVVGDVCAKLSGMGINVGGNYEAMSTSVWTFAIEFWPK